VRDYRELAPKELISACAADPKASRSGAHRTDDLMIMASGVLLVSDVAAAIN
jgi:hypothetical protein